MLLTSVLDEFLNLKNNAYLCIANERSVETE
nr:MAG TPA: hypothetical protein [Bacteriophage sp.]